MQRAFQSMINMMILKAQALYPALFFCFVDLQKGQGLVLGPDAASM